MLLNEFVWPDIDNTYQYFSYDESGIVNVSALIQDDNLKEKIQKTLNLMGLQKRPPRIGSPDWEKASDRRYEHRIQAWYEANDYLLKYDAASNETKEDMLPFIITIVT